MTRVLAGALAGVSLLVLTGAARADEAATAVEQVVVTATRIPVDEQKLAAMMTRISGEDLAARNANDLRTTLALVSGAEAPAGGDAGPASAVPSFWGLHEFDAFLLVVDGVPWGGAFNPAISSLDLNNVDRVEVLKGAAPVAFGQTAFVGVIQVFHSPAGEARPEMGLSVGEHGSYAGNLVLNLPGVGDWKQSLSVSAENQGYADRYEKVRDGKLLYRAAGPFAGGDVRLDLDVSLRRDKPQSPTVREEGGGLTDLTPLNGNFNTADARLNENRAHGSVVYDRKTPLGVWSTMASVAYSEVRDVRGFLRGELTDNPAESNADYQSQHRRILDTYLDTHLAFDGPFGAKLLAGADALVGVGHQISRNGEYHVPLNGRTRAPAASSLHVDEINTLADTRIFAGQYVQADWSPSGAITIIGGLRVNETSERKRSGHVDTLDPAADEAEKAKRISARVSGNIGVTWRVWQEGVDHLALFTDYRNTGQPGAVDFGPDYTPEVLKSERAQIYEAGFKGSLLKGRLSFEAASFRMDDRNLEVSTTNINGLPIIENAGSERLTGVEAEAQYHAARDLDLYLSGSWHDAYFTKYVATEGGANIDVGGKSLTLSPHWLFGGGVVYAPQQGLGGSIVVNYVGKRYLDIENKAQASAYTTVDAGLSYKTGKYRFTLTGSNLTDRRDPASASEFGDGSFYRVSGRKVMIGMQITL